MPRSSVYLDECVNKRLVIRLRWRGFQATTAGEVGLLEASDEVQLAYAARHGLLLITHNKRHFATLHDQYMLAGWPHHGVLTLPLTPVQLLDLRIALSLDWIAALPDYRSTLFRWHEIQQRLIHGERIPGYSEDEVRRALGHSA
ncbi:MAG: DUF5615 family PIN-like protein [Thermomicrobiales bacterium]